MNNPDPIVTIQHVRDELLCSRGTKAWFARYNLDFKHFLQVGYPASVIEGTGDALGLRVGRRARDEAAAKEAS